MRSRRAEIILVALTGAACAEPRETTSEAVPAESPGVLAQAHAETKPAPTAVLVPANHTDIPAPPSCGVGMKLVPGGTLSTLERGRDVAVGPFCLDEVEVDVRSWRACEAAGGCPRLSARTDWDNPDEDHIASRFCNGGRSGVDDQPANCVSLEEAAGYCAREGKRLPTGDEWEWAARGGDDRRATPWGSPVATDQICWGKPRKRNGTCARRSHARDLTALGIHDLGGNVSEWVSPPTRSGNPAARWVYGASWYAVDDGYARAALGGVQTPARRAETIGFRCASDAP